MWRISKGHRCQHESENKAIFYFSSCSLKIIASFENTFQTWSVVTGTLCCFCEIKRAVWGFIIRESIELMKDLVPFNFISFTTALSLPFPEHKQIKRSRVIHLLCYQTLLLLGMPHRLTHTHREGHTSFGHWFGEAVTSHHCRGIYF